MLDLHIDEVAHGQSLDLSDLLLLTELLLQNVVGSVEDMQNGVGSDVVGSVDKDQDFLDIVLCDHESPGDQNLADPSNSNEQQRQQQPPAESNCKRQHQPPAATAATAIVEAPAPALPSTISFSEPASMTEATAETCISATHWDATVPRAAQCAKSLGTIPLTRGC